MPKEKTLPCMLLFMFVQSVVTNNDVVWLCIL
jgi:hypothetical protein